MINAPLRTYITTLQGLDLVTNLSQKNQIYHFAKLKFTYKSVG